MNKFITTLTAALLFIITLPAHAWWISEPEIDQLRGTVEIATGFRSKDGLTSIMIRCKNNRTSMSISYTGSFFPDRSEVIYKINDGPVRTHIAHAAASYDLLVIAEPIPMIKHMLKGGEKGNMIIEFELEYYSNVQTTIPLYDRRKPNAVLVETIKPIRKTCNW